MVALMKQKMRRNLSTEEIPRACISHRPFSSAVFNITKISRACNIMHVSGSRRGGHLFPMSYISQVTYFPKKTKKTHIFPKKFGKYVTWEICDFPGHIFPNSQRSHISQKSRYLGTIPRYLTAAEPKSCRKRPTNLGLEKRLKMSLLFPARRPRPLKTLPLAF